MSFGQYVAGHCHRVLFFSRSFLSNEVFCDFHQQEGKRQAKVVFFDLDIKLSELDGVEVCPSGFVKQEFYPFDC